MATPTPDMSPLLFFFLEGLAAGACIAAAIICAVWWSDTRDRDQKSLADQAEAYEDGYSEGYDAGRRLRFFEKCQIERRCRVIEKQFQEMDKGEEDRQDETTVIRWPQTYF